jgi:hypothetical protein
MNLEKEKMNAIGLELCMMRWGNVRHVAKDEKVPEPDKSRYELSRTDWEYTILQHKDERKLPSIQL